MSEKSDIQSLINEVVGFRDKREWEKFHTLKDLAMGLSIETAELMELFLWKTPEEIDKKLEEPEYLRKINYELADTLIYCLLMANKLDIDIVDIVHAKLVVNAQKYPVEKVKGLAKKYNEYPV